MAILNCHFMTCVNYGGLLKTAIIYWMADAIMAIFKTAIQVKYGG